MKDVTHETNVYVPRTRERSRYGVDADHCLGLPLGQMTNVSKSSKGEKVVEVIEIETATNKQLYACLKMLGWSLPRGGDPINVVLTNSKVLEILREYTDRNGRVTIQNTDFIEAAEGRSPCCFYMPKSNDDMMLSPEQMQLRRQAKLNDLSKTLSTRG